jgi:hypothetical protein
VSIRRRQTLRGRYADHLRGVDSSLSACTERRNCTSVIRRKRIHEGDRRSPVPAERRPSPTAPRRTYVFQREGGGRCKVTRSLSETSPSFRASFRKPPEVKLSEGSETSSASYRKPPEVKLSQRSSLPSKRESGLTPPDALSSFGKTCEARRYITATTGLPTSSLSLRECEIAMSFFFFRPTGTARGEAYL